MKTILYLIMKMERDKISLYSMVKKNLKMNFNVWSVMIFSVSVCVFVQCLFSGFTAGIVNKTRLITSDLPSAFKGWNIFMSAVVSVLIAVIVATTVLTIISERRKDIAVLFSIGVHRKDIIKLNIVESFLAGISSYLIGLSIALIVGFLIDINHSSIGQLTSTMIPFELNMFMLISFVVVLGSVIISNTVMVLGIFRASIVEVMNYE